MIGSISASSVSSLFGGGGGSSMGNGMSSIAYYQSIVGNYTQTMNNYKNDPTVSSDVKYFQQNIGKVKNVDDLLNNYRLLNFTLTAFGLQGEIDAKALLKKVLTSDTTDPNSFANQMNDPRFKQMASAFAFATLGTQGIQLPQFKTTMEQLYYTNSFETSVGDQNMAVRQALYFARQAGSVSNAYSIIADPTIGAVVRGALGMPQQEVTLSVARQKSDLDAKLNYSDFKDKSFIQKTIMQYLAGVDAQNSTQATMMGSLFTSGGGSGGGGGLTLTSSMLNIVA